jgi:hypothetical protein
MSRFSESSGVVSAATAVPVAVCVIVACLALISGASARPEEAARGVLSPSGSEAAAPSRARVSLDRESALRTARSAPSLVRG